MCWNFTSSFAAGCFGILCLVPLIRRRSRASYLVLSQLLTQLCDAYFYALYPRHIAGCIDSTSQMRTVFLFLACNISTQTWALCSLKGLENWWLTHVIGSTVFLTIWSYIISQEYYLTTFIETNDPYLPVIHWSPPILPPRLAGLLLFFTFLPNMITSGEQKHLGIKGLSMWGIATLVIVTLFGWDGRYWCILCTLIGGFAVYDAYFISENNSIWYDPAKNGTVIQNVPKVRHVK